MTNHFHSEEAFRAHIKNMVLDKMRLMVYKFALIVVATLIVAAMFHWSREGVMMAAFMAAAGNAPMTFLCIRGFPKHLAANQASPDGVHDLNRLSIVTDMIYVAASVIVPIVMLTVALGRPE